MKSRQPKFIVEFKSNRRTKARPNSIWGDTDFKALAREVETSSSHLFSAPAAQNDAPLAAPPPCETASKPDVRIDTVVVASTESVREQLANAEQGINLPAVPEMPKCELETKLLSTIAPPKRAKPARAFSRKLAPANTTAGFAAPSTPAENDVTDEIAALYAENRRLRAELAKRVYAENVQLRQMLSRFTTR